jgi:predicted oxidoreductase (fatty acid repression mutant protein)
MSDFVSALERRHSQYAITETSKVPDADLVETIKRITLSVPSAFNSQSQRVVVLFGADHARLWNIVKEALRDVAADEEAFAKTQAKIDAFAAGHGTVLFFDDTAVTTDLGVRFPLYAEHFPSYAEQSNGMLQLAVWTALSERGLGASLQHYNPLIDAAVRRDFALPATWSLMAQMPFGDVVRPAEPSERIDADERVRVLGL